MPAAAFAVLLFQGGLKSGKGHGKGFFSQSVSALPQ